MLSPVEVNCLLMLTLTIVTMMMRMMRRHFFNSNFLRGILLDGDDDSMMCRNTNGQGTMRGKGSEDLDLSRMSTMCEIVGSTSRNVQTERENEDTDTQSG